MSGILGVCRVLGMGMYLKTAVGDCGGERWRNRPLRVRWEERDFVRC